MDQVTENTDDSMDAGRLPGKEEIENVRNTFSRYDYMEVIGRVESGTETESDAGTLTGRKWLKTSGTSFPAKAEKLLF